MSDILDTTVHEMDETEFFAHEGAYILRNSHQIALTRAELQALYARIQNIMTDELRAAGWYRPIEVSGWRKKGQYGEYWIDEAWRIMNAEKEQ